MKSFIALGLTTLFLVGCASTSVEIPRNEDLPSAGPLLTDLADGILSPVDAIVLAVQNAPEGVQGTYALQVRAVGERYGVYYLNSEENYCE